MKFCANPICRWHIEAGDNNRLRYDLCEQDIRQLTLIDSATGRRLALCEVCANAVAMANQNYNDERRTKSSAPAAEPATEAGGATQSD